jgi:hypothetical protein
MKNTNSHQKGSVKTDRKDFLKRTAMDTVVSFKLEGIIISFEEAYKMAEAAASKFEKEGRLTLA